MMRRILLILALGLLATGCNDGKTLLRAKVVTDANELVGGPGAKGKVGDFLLENDRIRAVIAGYGASWAAGIFGGTLVDLDLRRTRAEYAYGRGFDAFAETFPTMNLIIVNPDEDVRRVLDGERGFEVTTTPGSIEIVSDGSDGVEAIVRVKGSGGYIFDALKFVNLDFLRDFVSRPIDLEALGYGAVGNIIGTTKLYIPAIAKALPQLAPLLPAIAPGITPEATAVITGLDLDLFRLLSRLRFEFDFQTDYIVRPGQPYVTIRTTVHVAPPTKERAAACPPLEGCDLDCGTVGYAMQETLVDCDPVELCKFEVTAFNISAETKDSVFCPICECAEDGELPVLTESRSIFNDILGDDLARWSDPTWRSGLVAGDFLFFGKHANIFAPGIGYDENRKIFENLWQSVGTVGNPIAFDWVAGIGEDAPVSYAVVTRNEQRRDGARWAECPTYRFAATWVDPAKEADLVAALHDELAWREGLARGAARALVVDRLPVVLETFATDSVTARGSEAEFVAAALDSARGRELAAIIGSAELGVLPAADCLPGRMLVPIFTTSATAVMTHESIDGLEERADGVIVDRGRTFTYERYLVVGEGDVGSMLDTLLELRGEPFGYVRGGVFEQGTTRPIHHAEVFALLDPRPTIATLSDARKARLPELPADLGDWSYDLLVRVNHEVFGHLGFVSQMQSDVGDDPVPDGGYKGALPPGEYLFVAKGKDRAVSAPVPVTIEDGATAIAHLVLGPPATVAYRVVDQAGAATPAKLVFQMLDPATGEPLAWDGANRVELGDGRADYGVREIVLATDGEGEVDVEPGLYRIYASRGFEFEIDVKDRVDLKPGQTVDLKWQIARSVDTRGWISGDFHMHQGPSVDSEISLEDRVMSNVVEGLEFVTSSDHDTITDYRPTLAKLGLYHLLGFQLGVEVSPLEFGHYNAYPVDYDARELAVHDPPPWQQSRITTMFEEMRKRAAGAPEDLVIQINHGRDGFMGMFAQTGVNGLTFERDTPGMEMCNAATVDVPCDFDAMEVMNERRFELIRTPTVWEKTAYNTCYSAIIAARERAPFSVAAPDASSLPVDTEASLCGELQTPPDGCTKELEAGTIDPSLPEAERARLTVLADHCAWHAEFRAAMARCNGEVDLVTCKRYALEGLKMLFVRYFVERTPEEQEALLHLRENPLQDPECDLARATAGCAARTNDEGVALAGCGGEEECACHLCVCGTEETPGLRPACCQSPGEGDAAGNGWTAECAALCRTECHSCGVQPCMDSVNVLDDWMGFLNLGFTPTAVGNSDSHGLDYEGGLPRNWLKSGTDDPANIDHRDVNRTLKAGELQTSTGPFLELRVNGAELGSTVTLPADATVKVDLRVQTPGWFGVDHVELYRNGHIERTFLPRADKEAIVDLDTSLDLGRPAEDSWYVLVAYGVNPGQSLEPVYNGRPYGTMLLQSVIALGAQQLLAPFEDLLGAFSGFLDVNSLLGASEVPDSFPALPFAVTNPIWVDVDGGGFDPPNGEDRNGDGEWDLPAFCSQPCALEKDAEGMVVEAQGSCPTAQVCLDDGTGAGTGRCVVPLDKACVGADWANDLSQKKAPLEADGLTGQSRFTRKATLLFEDGFRGGAGPVKKLRGAPIGR